MKMSKNKFNKNISKGPRNLVIMAFVLASSLLLLTKLTEMTQGMVRYSFSEFLDKVQNDQVKRVQIAGQDIHGELKDGSSFETIAGKYEKTWDILREHKVDFTVDNSA